MLPEFPLVPVVSWSYMFKALSMLHKNYCRTHLSPWIESKLFDSSNCPNHLFNLSFLSQTLKQQWSIMANGWYVFRDFIGKRVLMLMKMSSKKESLRFLWVWFILIYNHFSHTNKQMSKEVKAWWIDSKYI